MAIKAALLHQHLSQITILYWEMLLSVKNCRTIFYLLFGSGLIANWCMNLQYI